MLSPNLLSFLSSVFNLIISRHSYQNFIKKIDASLRFLKNQASVKPNIHQHNDGFFGGRPISTYAKSHFI